MQYKRKISTPQQRFTAIIEKLIEQKVLPANIIICMHYQSQNRDTSQQVWYPLTDIHPRLKKQIPEELLKRLKNGNRHDHACFKYFLTATYGGTVTNNIFKELPSPTLLAVSAIVGASILFTGKLLFKPAINRPLETAFSDAVTLAEFEELASR